MELRVTKTGNSLGVVLPKELLANLKLDKGDVLWASESQTGYHITPYDPDFGEQMEAAREIMKKRRNILRELSK